MKEIFLSKLQLKTFTEQDASDYCQLNSINPENITELNLFNNQLTDILGIKLFKNIKHLYIHNNKISNMLVIKDLKLLQSLNIGHNPVTDILILKHLNNLKYLNIGYIKTTDISVIEYLVNLEDLNINYLKLKSDQIKYINSLNNLKELHSLGGFKNRSVLNQLNKNIKVIK